MHAIGKHGGSMVESVQEVGYKLYECGFVWNLLAFEQQVCLRLRVRSVADILELQAGEQGEFAGTPGGKSCQTQEGHTYRGAVSRPRWMVVLFI